VALMKQWSTDGSFDADMRYPTWLKWSFEQEWMPEWALSFLFRFAARR